MLELSEKWAEIGGKRYVSVADAAEYLGAHEVTVYRLMRKRTERLETIDFAGRVLVEVESLEVERVRRENLRREADELAARINAQPEKVSA